MTYPRASPLLPALACLVVGATIVTGAAALHSLLWKRAYERTTATEKHFLSRDAFTTEARIRSRVNDLFLLKGIAEEALKDSPSAQAAVKAIRPAAEKLMVSRGVYDQARLLDPQGKEIFRLDREGEKQSHIVEVSAEKWRNRADRGYYSETLELAEDTAVFSPFDFEVEHGGNSEPRKPVTRISAKIIDPKGELAAIIILNIDGRSMVLPRQFAPKMERNSYVLNQGGFWLAGPQPDSEWAFLDPARSKESLDQSDPALWQKLHTTSEGSFFDGEYLYCFRALNPTSPALEYPTLSMPVAHPERLQWTILKKLPKKEIWAEFGSARKTLWASTGLALLFALPATWIGVRAFRQRDLIRIQLDKLVQSYLYGVAVLEAVRDPKGKITNFRLLLANEAADRVYGESLTQQIGSILVQKDRAKQLDEIFDHLCRIVAEDEPVTFEQKHTQNGVDSWMLLSAAKFNDGVIVNMVDITERRLAEEKLRQSENLLQMASKLAKLGGWRIEYPEEKIFWSREVYAIHEVDWDTPPTMERALKFFTAEYAETICAAINRTKQDGTPVDVEVPLITDKGNHIWVRIIAEGIFENGVIQTVYGVIEDVTEVKEALAHEQELSHAAKVAERAKANFLATMSHEIRTPMNGILGFAEMLAHRPLEQEDAESVRIIKDSGQTLLRVLDDILDYSRIESGRLHIERAQGSPSALVEQIRVLLTSLIQSNKVVLQTEVASDIPEQILFDADRTRQVLVNLAGNALKFTQRGSVTIGVKRGGSFAEPRVGLEFYVRDTGIGISPEKLQHIFEPFTQADDSISRRYGGTGLGLAISRSLAQLMGGNLTAKSTLGQGSTFTLTVPVEAITDANSVTRPVEHFAFDTSFAKRFPLKILVAEDDAINLRLITKLLQKFGYQSSAVPNGLAAVAQCQAEHPDCILMDIHMPDLDGLGAISQIRAWEQATHQPQRVFISALTADVLPDDRLRTLRAGADDYLTKPINLAALAEILQRASERNQSA